mmetsp:Transcript_20012/g.20344  ORF Transcript_20012/g.20344 Transcript_20012/m.20344 type:complete len:108 (-) Transcript_20012:136-459(-)
MMPSPTEFPKSGDGVLMSFYIFYDVKRKRKERDTLLLYRQQPSPPSKCLKMLQCRRDDPRRRRDSLAFGTWLILGSRSPAGGRIFLSQTIIMTKKNCPILGGIRLAR